MKNLLAGLAVALLLFTGARAGAQPNAQDVIAAVDKIRNPGQPFRVTTTLIEYINGQARNRSVLVVYARENRQTQQFDNVVRYAEPARDVGKMVLMNGSNMWFYDPSSKASVRISPQQRLMGQASDGDVVTVNLARDYKASLVGEEKLKDADHRERDCWHLDLEAAGDEAVYSRVEYWVEKGTNRAVKGKFYSDSGRLLKIAYFHKPAMMLGGLRDTETIIIDAVDQNLVTTMTTSDMRAQDIPDAWFQRDYLPYIKAD
ncbi:MAG: outer membrane lipoprotein-sorting protein [Alphaproteobacteria bacterium]|nr:outer membrane lipoprotein-sorting protein [Alphaproteobacteria bacterium]